jgi:ketosteroid isomerase-like protein
VLALAVFGPTALGQSRPASASADQAEATAEIKGMIAKYAEAVNREPVDLDLAGQVWSQSPDVSFIFPLGEEHGWAEIKQKFYQDIMEARFSERTLTPRDIQVHAYGDSAWAEFSWRFVARSRKDGSRVETSGRETQIYRKIGPHRWALVHVHYSAMAPSER